MGTIKAKTQGKIFGGVMFEIGDLVKLKRKGVCLSFRDHPDKICGLVVEIEREAFYTYEGDYDDRITVKWLLLDLKEELPEFLLEKITKDT
jgi:hypothetical protein